MTSYPCARRRGRGSCISLQTFGGPAGQIAVMQRELVDERRWIGERRFLHALSYCMLLPGPEAQQLAIYTGWLLNGWLGGLIAGVLFVLPGFVAMLALSWVYVAHGDTALVTGLFLGLAPAVVAIVVQAVVRIGGRALRHRALVWLAVAAFLALAVLGLPFPLVVLGAGVVGWALGRWRPEVMVAAGGPRRRTTSEAPLVPDDALHRARPSARRNLVDPRRSGWRSGWRRSRSPGRWPRARARSSPTRACSSAGWRW